MATEFDVAVLGSGTAGSSAALAAARNGANVCVITGPPGTTGMFSGAWTGPCPDELRSALASTGYQLEDIDHALPHPNGSLLSCDAAAPPHAAANPHDSLVIGIAGLGGFHAESLSKQWGARGAAVVLLDATPASGWAVTALAAAIEADPQPIITALLNAAKQHRAHRLLVPAVLGRRHDAAIHQHIQNAVGIPVGEALGVPPSLPGWRLQRALHAALANAGVTVIEHRAVTAASAGDRADQLTLANGDVIRAHSFVLATGKYAAGGILSDGAFREPVFDCPVWIDHLGDAFERAEPLLLTDADRTEDQPLLVAGVHANADHRVVDRSGDVVYSNVFIAGTIRAGWSAGHHAIGLVAADGWTAGLQAVKR